MGRKGKNDEVFTSHIRMSSLSQIGPSATSSAMSSLHFGSGPMPIPEEYHQLVQEHIQRAMMMGIIMGMNGMGMCEMMGMNGVGLMVGMNPLNNSSTNAPNKAFSSNKGGHHPFGGSSSMPLLL